MLNRSYFSYMSCGLDRHTFVWTTLILSPTHPIPLKMSESKKSFVLNIRIEGIQLSTTATFS